MALGSTCKQIPLDPQGNLIETKVYSGALPTDPVEIFDVDYMNRIAGYLRQDGGAGTQARFSVGYFDGTGESRIHQLVRRNRSMRAIWRCH